MSKMSELALVIDEMITCGVSIIKTKKELTDCGEHLIQTAKKLKEIFSTENPRTPTGLEEKKVLLEKEEKPIPKRKSKVSPVVLTIFRRFVMENHLVANPEPKTIFQQMQMMIS